MALTRQSVVVFNEAAHTYTNTKTGLLMTPVSKVKDLVHVPFDGNAVSGFMAMAEAKQTGNCTDAMVMVIKKRILAEWENTKNIANTRGTHIHKVIESLIPFLKESDLVLHTKIIAATAGQNYHEAVTEIIFSLRKYYQSCSEYILYSEYYNVCGTADHIGLRQNTKTSLIDIDDWKTNEFTYDSVKIKPDSIKHYNKFLLEPLDYLEDCKYIDLALQLSMYGVLAEETYPGFRIGRLTGHNIDHRGVYRKLPVPYMRREAIALLEHKRGLKKLPTLPVEINQLVETDDEW